jgi:membrane protein
VSASGNTSEEQSRVKAFWQLLKEAEAAWEQDNAWRIGAALAYFSIFSLAPLLIITVVVSGVVFGQKAAEGHLVSQISDLIGIDGARFIESMIRNIYVSGSSTSATVISIATILLGATAVFVELRSALNTLWHVQEKPMGTVKSFLQARFFSFLMVLGIGILLLASLAVSVIMAAVSAALSGIMAIAGGFADFFVSIGEFALLFALIFKYLADVIVRWKDVLVGASFTSLLFSIGKMAIGLYLGRSAVSSSFGAAGSLVIVMLWTFYSLQIFLYGAEFTRFYAKRFGSDIRPGRNAMIMT